MDFTLTKEQLEALPISFTCTHESDTHYFLEQDLTDPIEREQNLVYDPNNIPKKTGHAIDYVFEVEKDQFRLLHCNRKGYFSGTTLEKIETRRGMFELARHLGLFQKEFETIEMIYQYVLPSHLPATLDGFIRIFVPNKHSVIDYVADPSEGLYVTTYKCKKESFNVRMGKGGIIYINHEKKGKGVHQLREVVQQEMNKRRVKTLFQ